MSEYPRILHNFQNCALCEKDLKRGIISTIASIWGENMLGYLSLGIICSLKLIVFLEQSSRKTARFSEQIMSADKYPSIFSRQMEAIVYRFSAPNGGYCLYSLQRYVLRPLLKFSIQLDLRKASERLFHNLWEHTLNALSP